MSPIEIVQSVGEWWWGAWRFSNIAVSFLFVVLAVLCYPSWTREPVQNRMFGTGFLIIVVVNAFATADLYFKEVEGGARIYLLTGASLFGVWSLWTILRAQRAQEGKSRKPPLPKPTDDDDSPESKAYRAEIIKRVHAEMDEERKHQREDEEP